MKSIHLKSSLLIVLLAIFALSFEGYAQRGRGMGLQTGNRALNQAGMQGTGYGNGYRCTSIPNLTEEQTAQIEELRLKHFSEQQTYHNELGELRARRRTLCSSNVPINQLDDNTDAMTTLRNKMMKKRDRYRKEVRALLTKEQQVYFDANSNYGRMGRGIQQGRSGRGNGMGMNTGRGRAHRNW